MSIINKQDNIFGCFVSGPSLLWNATQEDERKAEEKGQAFRKYIWGDHGIDEILKQVINIEYGKDIRLILFQFYLNPIEYELENLDKTAGYRKREKSIGANIIVTDDNFFDRSNEEKITFLESKIINALSQLEKDYKDKLDTRFDLLIRELRKLFNCSQEQV